MRTFIAIELPKEIQDTLADLQEQLKTSGADVKWVQPQNIHLTLKFLGERDDKKVEKIKQTIDEVAKEKKSFFLSLSTLGAFPKVDYPRVIWVGVDKGDNEAKAIALDLEKRIAKIGIPKEERPFSSHITLGRVRSSLNLKQLAQGLKNQENVFTAKNLEFEVSQITLFKSTLTPKGPIYEALKEASLKTT